MGPFASSLAEWALAFLFFAVNIICGLEALVLSVPVHRLCRGITTTVHYHASLFFSRFIASILFPVNRALALTIGWIFACVLSAVVHFINHFYPARPYDPDNDPEEVSKKSQDDKPKRPMLSRYRVSQEGFSKKFPSVPAEEVDEVDVEWFDALEYQVSEDGSLRVGKCTRGMPVPIVRITRHG